MLVGCTLDLKEKAKCTVIGSPSQGWLCGEGSLRPFMEALIQPAAVPQEEVWESEHPTLLSFRFQFPVGPLHGPNTMGSRNEEAC